MGKIVILDENTSNKIAAGEVIEKPASAVKELVENSIDAGAGHISVEIKNGGISLIKVTDNGCGIDEDDVEIAFERHATSKIRSADDLDSIKTMGFRGEALASIAAVASVELTTRIQKNSHGNFIKVQGGNLVEIKQTGCPVGTTIIIKDLFYNTPARFKFLKKDSTEAGYISEIMSRIALSAPQISFRLISNNSNVLHTPGNNDLLSTIFSIYGKETAHNVLKLDYENNKIKVSGYAGRPEIARSNRNQQSIFLNGRYIRSKVISAAIDEAYNTYLMKNKHAFTVLNLELNPVLVDVNVHPTKMEVRFSDEQEIFRSVYHSILNALSGKPLIKDIITQERKDETFKFEEKNNIDKTAFVQANFIKDKSPQSFNTFKPHVSSDRENLRPLFQPENLNNIPVKAIQNIERKLPEKSKIVESHMNINEEPQEYVPEVRKNFLEDARIIGQAFSTYIIAQSDDGLILIDQHAAHERILYEKLKEKYRKKQPMSQFLLAPAAIELTNQEIRIINDEKEFLNNIGYKYEEFGNNSILLREIPFVDDRNIKVKETFLEVVDFLLNKDKSDYGRLMDEALHTIACKAAVKANKRLDEIEIKNIIRE
ncbi:MAG TPA: DNA mismatch repair endonuclease MutL, partial [Clostridia bacterium]|nr:DNA mismatch repair endonuclease MutL [Clostridia bacterium]